MVANNYPIGSIIRLELQCEDNDKLVKAELSRKRFRELAWQQGEQVWVNPRSVRIF
jgi:sulfate transport system ATP-binding protein